MWTGGFPEPLTFSLRARRHLRARRGDFDVVHDNQTLGYGLLGDVGAPLVTTIHHPITVDRQLELDAAEGWKRRASVRRWYAFTRMQKRVARRLPSVLTVSGTSRQEIVDHLGVAQDRIHVVHIGADTDLFSPDPAVRQVPGRIVTTSSADVPLKGLVFLVEALAKVRTEHPGAHLVVVGKRAEDGPVAQAIERYGLEGAVEFVKGISDAELVDLVRSAEVACVPSLYEGFSSPPPRPWPPVRPWWPPPAERSRRSPDPTARPASRYPRRLGRPGRRPEPAPGRPAAAGTTRRRRPRPRTGPLHLGPSRPGHGGPLPRGDGPLRAHATPPLRAAPQPLRAPDSRPLRGRPQRCRPRRIRQRRC